MCYNTLKHVMKMSSITASSGVVAADNGKVLEHHKACVIDTIHSFHLIRSRGLKHLSIMQTAPDHQ